ncbi:MAG TPA: pyrroline-5-carboxylate reductase [Syntrophales bacterium]|jgi:pyrroline-5-carboxylate reductase|nr:pyrroline-5-carboxylate reductase [Syntrophales bacterium]HON22678.1 pyrroline-5-carboxylate reductase [Syntrophales bacterium]HOU77406.1 pyrroline-5-carboxylate reductase [Syntrophales bacterium]HPC33486.1 pyrroline-5-carboxylate reductase [Syntrophales bacterium]HQG35185.1 pyrroline-5-carboxylate reductase [Syntrophales bacterium]
MLKGKKIGVIGGGKMGGALIGGIVNRRLLTAAEVIVADVDKKQRAEIEKNHGVKTTESNRLAVEGAHIIILAVKPQNMAEVLADISGVVDESKLVISIAAGIPVRFIADRLKQGVRIIRTMPNTPALIGEGMTALAAGPAATAEDMETALHIFTAVGKTVVVKEEQLDAVTGLSGSGPAYAFIMIEALADGGVHMGLSRDTALTLAAQTLLGASRLFLAGEKHPGQLKDMVTSPAGTTIAGIRALEDGKLRGTLMAAVEAATRRSQALGS